MDRCFFCCLVSSIEFCDEFLCVLTLARTDLYWFAHSPTAESLFQLAKCRCCVVIGHLIPPVVYQANWHFKLYIVYFFHQLAVWNILTERETKRTVTSL